jgi:hypothetical protein
MAAGVPSKHWNVFVRELEAVMGTRGYPITRLDDLGVVEFPEKVRRLQLSFKSGAHLHVLNPEELQRLVEILGLSELEQARLRAALLATAVERTLMDRIDPYTALMAANDVFTILFAAMRARPGSAVANVKGGPLLDVPVSTDDATLDEALDLIDRGVLALQVGEHVATPAGRRVHGYEAQSAFAHALELLGQVRTDAQEGAESAEGGERTESTQSAESTMRRAWAAEALGGQAQAQALMHPVEEG